MLSTTPTGTRPRIRSLTSSLRTLGGSALLAAATAATTSPALAQSDGEFIGFDCVVSVNGEGNTVYEVYSVYDGPDAIVLQIFNAEIPGDFIQSDVQIGAGGTWAPNASLDIPGFSDSNNDSYATIGYGVGAASASNGTALDDTWLDETGGLGPTVPSGAGWYNGNPSNDQVVTPFDGGVRELSGYALKVGQFVQNPLSEPDQPL